jgi:hypothetical protein
VAAGGSGFKKVYRCPLRRRPLSESVDAENLIVSNAATDLANADRVTFRTRMRQSVMKRMQHLKVYRDVDLGQPSMEMRSSVEEEKDAISGVRITNRSEDLPFTILECYCLIDLEGDEHKEKGEATGLPRPYKISIEKSSRTVLEIRRNWKKEDELERAREVFVKYPYVPGFGFYDIGLIQILGNPTTAATALLRIMIDSGIFGNFPGGLISKGGDKQNSTDISVPPGGFAPIDTSMSPDGDIRRVVMALPYKEAGPGIQALYQEITTAGMRLGSIPDTPVAEGNAEVPVGTTIANIEQASKILDAVHRRLHTAQSKEFTLLRDLFVENPQDFIRFNQKRDNNWDEAELLSALNDYNMVPRADPNTSSNLQRIMRAQAVYMVASAHPELFVIDKTLNYLLKSVGVTNPQHLLQPPQQMAPPPDPKAQAAMISAQAQQTTAQAKMADVQSRAQNQKAENADKDAQRQTDVQVAQMKLKGQMIEHAGKTQADALSQVSSQQHERAIAQAKIDSEERQHATGLVSDHLLQQNEPSSEPKP